MKAYGEAKKSICSLKRPKEDEILSSKDFLNRGLTQISFK